MTAIHSFLCGFASLCEEKRFTPSRQGANEEIMMDTLCAFAPSREAILEARTAENVMMPLEETQ